MTWSIGWDSANQWAFADAVASLAIDTSLGQTGNAVDPGSTNPDPQAAARTARNSRRAAVGTATAFGSVAALGLVSNFKLNLKRMLIWFLSIVALMTIIQLEIALPCRLLALCSCFDEGASYHVK